MFSQSFRLSLGSEDLPAVAGGGGLSSWDEGAAWKERWRIDDPEAALWQDYAMTVPAYVADTVVAIGDQYGEGALTYGAQQLRAFENEVGGPVFLQIDGATVPPPGFYLPVAMHGLTVDIGYRTPVGVFVGKYQLHEVLPRILAQEIIVRYPSDPNAHALMAAFLEEHNTITYPDGVACINDSTPPRPRLGTFYGGWYGPGEYGVITDGDGSITMLSSLGSVTAPPWDVDPYAYVYGPQVTAGYSLEIIAENASEITDFELGVHSIVTSTDLVTLCPSVLSMMIDGMTGFMPSATTWPATAQVMSFRAEVGPSLIGTWEAMDLPNASNRAVCTFFGMGSADISGVADFRDWPELEYLWIFGAYSHFGVNLHGNLAPANLSLTFGVGFSTKSVYFLDVGGAINTTGLPTVMTYLDKSKIRYLDVSGHPEMSAQTLNFPEGSLIEHLKFSDIDTTGYVAAAYCSELVEFDVHDSTSPTYFSLSFCGAPDCTVDFSGASCTAMFIYADDSNIVSVDMTNTTVPGFGMAIYGAGGITSLDIEGATFDSTYVGECHAWRDIFAQGASLGLYPPAATEGETLDRLLIELESNGLSNGTIDIRLAGGTVRTEASDAAVAALLLRGYTILENTAPTLAATWDADQKNAAVTLSDGDLTASATITTQYRGVRSEISHSIGKRAAKFTINYSAAPVNEEIEIGISDGLWNPTAGGGIGGDYDYAFLTADGYVVSPGNVGTLTAAIVASGSSAYMFVDFDAGLVEFNATGVPGTEATFSIPSNKQMWLACAIVSDAGAACSVTTDQTFSSGAYPAWST